MRRLEDARAVATLDDVRRVALALPETEERGSYGGAPSWHVRGKGFVWERPLSRAEQDALGRAAPTGGVIGVRVADLEAKESLLAAEPDVAFTTPHFDGHCVVLVRLTAVGLEELRELVTDAWLIRAPKRLGRAFLTDC